MKILKSGVKASLIAFATLAATLSPAQAEEFTLLIYETRQSLEARTDAARADAYWGGYNAFAGALAQAGVLRGGTALSETQVQTLTKRGGAVRVSGSARIVGGARLGGYFLIDVANIEEAVRWAGRAPIANGGAVEVRPHRVNPTMGMTPGMAN